MCTTDSTLIRPARITSHQLLICRRKKHEHYFLFVVVGFFFYCVSVRCASSLCLSLVASTRYRWKHFFVLKSWLIFLSLTYSPFIDCQINSEYWKTDISPSDIKTWPIKICVVTAAQTFLFHICLISCPNALLCSLDTYALISSRMRYFQ